MGLRFHKQFGLGKWLRLNMSKSGLSVGVGPKGLNANIQGDRIRYTAGVPGSGVSYRGEQRTSSPLVRTIFWLLIAVVAVAALIQFLG
jgi:hypothetical protein